MVVFFLNSSSDIIIQFKSTVLRTCMASLCINWQLSFVCFALRSDAVEVLGFWSQSSWAPSSPGRHSWSLVPVRKIEGLWQESNLAFKKKNFCARSWRINERQLGNHSLFELKIFLRRKLNVSLTGASGCFFFLVMRFYIDRIIMSIWGWWLCKLDLQEKVWNGRVKLFTSAISSQTQTLPYFKKQMQAKPDNICLKCTVRSTKVTRLHWAFISLLSDFYASNLSSCSK